MQPDCEPDTATEAHNVVPAGESPPLAPPEANTPTASATRRNQRLRQLKQRMNQARQLNQQAVQSEGQHLGSNGVAESQRVTAVPEQAVDAVRRAEAQAATAERQRFHVNDYHNPQGQHRNYERSLRSLPSAHRGNVGVDVPLSTTTTTYDPLETAVDHPERERLGAQRLANELQRRIEKRQKRDRKRKEKEDNAPDDEDVGYINKRNKHFNEKIKRNYEQHTAEIRQNLERGTAL
ncbi:predicted protein [Phaeodactylum tricornutum CCAP 1055/1]|jgi:pre-mRNA-splicing factor SYF2|uniref:Pre-mRNA-splicing factor SYF2 n=2 Tax=Phaeodactylum tricornutum TaxID=2850 RepID=B7GDL3_PHATC|nr:predicted protein [Phaeodactylum tricornutum CCAP 1055/1]EEC43281.1 predicted protein [Phaeodactylum tricornutum CCAP 1055/1]|eukprot:XP_002185149.1 predicted protein [Phaeodactylum tricornutum CCAP 1055/1]